MNEFLNRLAASEQAFDNAEAITFSDHPEGKYTGKIEVARIEEDSRTGNDTIYASVHVRTEKGIAFISIPLNNHSSESQLSVVKGQLINLGFEGRLTGLPDYLPTLLGSALEIDVKHKPYKQDGVDKVGVNVYPRKIVAGSAQGAFPVASNDGMAPDTAGLFPPAQPVTTAAPANNLPFG